MTAPSPEKTDRSPPATSNDEDLVTIDGWPVNNLDLDGAIERLIGLARGSEPRYVVTPNVDHLMLLRTDPAFRSAYRGASLRLADGVPLLWAARLRGTPLRGKVSGSDLVEPLCVAAARESLSVYLLGGLPGAAESAARELVARCPGLKIAGMDCPPMGFERHPDQTAAVLRSVKVAAPDILLVALGAPKQECFMDRHCQELAVPLTLGVGAALDFVAGLRKRAPKWMSRCGAEWLFRLMQEPRRMAHRYLVRDLPFLGVLLDSWRARSREMP